MLVGSYLDLERRIGAALDCARAESDRTPSRELSLVITKLQEARLWMIEIDTEG